MPISSATTHTTIDVRDVCPPERRATIFAAFTRLDVDVSLDIVNDHDPKPLYSQLQLEARGALSWDYAEKGPHVWRVSLRKLARPHSGGGCCGGCGGGV